MLDSTVLLWKSYPHKYHPKSRIMNGVPFIRRESSYLEVWFKSLYPHCGNELAKHAIPEEFLVFFHTDTNEPEQSITEEELESHSLPPNGLGFCLFLLLLFLFVFVFWAFEESIWGDQFSCLQ